MKLVNSNANVDKVIWRCRSINPSHDIKINIRAGSFFENINVPLNAIYFLIFNCFIKNYSTRKASNEMKRFSEFMGQTKPNLNTIIKIFRLLRSAIKKYYHDYWNHNLLGLEPAEGGVASIEIDESEVIGNKKILWMFGVIDRCNKEARVYSVMDDRRKEKIITIN